MINRMPAPTQTGCITGQMEAARPSTVHAATRRRVRREGRMRKVVSQPAAEGHSRAGGFHAADHGIEDLINGLAGDGDFGCQGDAMA
ncbi:hypothetical protein GCM10023213_23910 [Prosthecobacter algae]|uniref:Uncharacterized protein n=1 Tax=Prosthecobacter algae TaxID=1144682 RepID=A0ABP9P4Q5_9BACT